MKTLADLRRDAKSGNLSLELLPVGIWQKGVVDRVKGLRKVIKANSVGIVLQSTDGKGESRCDIPKASLIEYTNESLKIFKPGYREPNGEENKVLKEWEKISSTEEFKNQAMYDALTDCSCTFYKEKAFFSDRGMEYLMGCHEQKGCYLDMNRRANGNKDYIRDDKIKGELILEYKVYMN